MSWSFFGKQRNNIVSSTRTTKGSLLRGRRSRFEELEARHMLAVLTVNADGVNSDVTAADTFLTLREALTVVNLADASALSADELLQVDTTIDPLGVNDIIRFNGVTAVTLAGTELPVNNPVTIDGFDRSTLTIDAATLSRVFNVSADAGNVTFKNVTITNGVTGANDGGAILSQSLGLLTIADSIVSGSTATTGAGGGVYASGPLTVLNTTVIGNTAVSGGGLYGAGNILLRNSTIAGNTATGILGAFGNGGGVHGAGTVTVESSTIGGILGTDANTAFQNGGGIFAPTVTLQNSTISQNAANGTATSDGGGVYALASITARNSTIANNVANRNGGGISTAGTFNSVASLVNSTIAGNLADAGVVGGLGGGVFVGGRFMSQNSIIIGNTDSGPNPDFTPGLVNNIRFTLIGDAVAATAAGPTIVGAAYTPNAPNSNIVGSSTVVGSSAIPIGTVLELAAPGVPLLANNNGTLPETTPTIALAAAPNPARDNGSNSLAAAVKPFGDGRGLPFARISGTRVDLGAFEDQLTGVANTAPVALPIANQVALAGSQFTFVIPAGTFTDSDGDELTFGSAKIPPPVGLPQWLTFNPNNRTFSGTPGANDVGATTIQVTAGDGKGGFASSTFTLNVVQQELPFQEEFNAPTPGTQIAPDPRLVQKSPTSTTTFSTSTTLPVINGAGNLIAQRLSQGARPVAAVDFVNPATAATITTVRATVSPGGGNGSSLWSNAVILFDFVDANNYKYAGVFEIIDQLVIGQVVNGVRQPLKRLAFPTAANDNTELSLAINRATNTATLTAVASGANLSQTFGSIGTGTVGVGTINANARFDSLRINA